MAIAGTCVWEVRTTGNDNNGGGYVPGAGTDYSQQDTPQLTVTDAAATGTTNLSSATGGFTSSMVNNIVNVVGQGRRQITAFVNSNNVTCGADWGTFSGATANVGGSVASYAVACGAAVAGSGSAYNRIYLTGSFTISSTSTNVANGLPRPPSYCVSEGYATTRGDGGRATLTCSGITSQGIVGFFANTNSVVFKNIAVDGANLSSITGFSATTNTSRYINCRAYRCTTGFNSSGNRCSFILCEAELGNNGFVVNGTSAYRCVAKSTLSSGFSSSGNSGALTECIAWNCWSGFTDAHGYYHRCVAYNPGSVGFVIPDNKGAAMIECISWSAGTYGATVSYPTLFLNNAEGDSGTAADNAGLSTRRMEIFA
mgnify:CR=1 FL=1